VHLRAWKLLIYDAVARTSSKPSIMFWLSGSKADIGVIRCNHRDRRSIASASRKLGVAYFGYQGREIQVVFVPNVGMYQVQITA
jgi:hypothetical protein